MFNLASQYASSGLFSEALSTYQQLIKNRSYANIGRLRLNIANLHFGLGQYALALKQYRMALDQVPAHFTTLRYVHPFDFEMRKKNRSERDCISGLKSCKTLACYSSKWDSTMMRAPASNSSCKKNQILKQVT